ncbi:MAG: DUF4838 domain-containing protein [Clostridia bacterium]|nr:DUF4838 domain-containing protein [Clostridia bacterium]
MKRRLKKWLALALSLITFTGAFVACDEEKQSSDGGSSSSVEKVFDDGIHSYKIGETNFDMVKNGSSEYKIVLPNGASETLNFAATELQLFFKEATGVTLPIVSDASVTYSQSAKVISLGETTLFEAAGLTVDKQTLDRNGFIIKTVGENIFISGAYDDGTNFGVYGYLEQDFHFDCLSNTCYYIDEGVRDLKLKNFDVVDVPDLKVRNNGNSFVTNSKTTMRRMRYTAREDGSTFAGSASAHTVFTHLPPATYNNPEKTETYHPDWYSNDGMQLCYTAHGKPEEREAMLAAAFEKMKSEFIKNTTGYLFIFSQEDKFTWCNCETCTKSKTKYNGSDAAVAIKFCNDLADKMFAWMQTEEGKPYARDFKVLFLAYGKSLVPPSVYNEKTKKYEAIDSEAVCNENTAVMFAPIEMDYQKSIYDEDNESFLRAFEGWGPISKNFNIYTYQANYNYFLVPFDVFNTMRDFYQYAAKMNTYWFFDLGQRKQSAGATGWTMLKNYISSKLAWDVNADVDALTDNFFKIYYGEASEVMREWYDGYRAHSKYMIDHGGMARANSVYLVMLNEEFWPSPLLDGWIEKAEAALKAIEPVKYTDIERYNELYLHIVTERVSVQYMLVKIYEDDYETSYIDALKRQIKTDCELAGIDVAGEGGAAAALSTQWAEWGLL